MDRAIKPITARIGGVSVYVSAGTRKAIRRRARQATVVAGYVAGISAAVLIGVAVLQSICCCRCWRVPPWRGLWFGGVESETIGSLHLR